MRDLIFGYADLYTLDYRTDPDGYVLTLESVKKKDVPLEAFHVTGTTGTYFLDNVRGSEMPAPGHATAIDLYCWFKNNALNNALNIKGKLKLDKKMLTYIAVGAIALIFCAWYYMA